MQITGTFTVIELLWIISTGLSTIFMCGLVFRSIDDLRFLHRAKVNSLREYAAKTSILTYMGGLTTQFLLFLVGILAAFTKNSEQHTNYVAQSILVLMSMIGTVIAVFIYERRVKIIDMIEEHEKKLIKLKT